MCNIVSDLKCEILVPTSGVPSLVRNIGFGPLVCNIVSDLKCEILVQTSGVPSWFSDLGA